MTTIDHTQGTRHLVDPELTSALDLFPPFAFSPEALPLIREGMRQALADGPDPADAYPDTVRREVRVPGLDGDPEVRALVYEPRQRAGTAPGLVWVHGGGFIIGTADDDDAICRRIVHETGAVVASVDYRLAPETPAPGPLNDCYAVLGWLAATAAELDIDTRRLAVGGASAGGGLAACLAILARDRAEVAVGFQALVYPMLDDRTGTTVPAHPYAGEFIWTATDNDFGWRSLLGRDPGGADVSAYEAAARVDDAAALPPTFLCVGSLDLFAVEDLAYATRLIEAGVPTELHVYAGGYHGFQMAPESQMSKAYFRDLIGSLSRFFNTHPVRPDNA